MPRSSQDVPQCRRGPRCSLRLVIRLGGSTLSLTRGAPMPPVRSGPLAVAAPEGAA